MKSGGRFVSSMKLLAHMQQYIADMNRPLDPPIIDEPEWQSRLQARNQVLSESEGNVVTAQGINFINVCSYINCCLFTCRITSMQRNITKNN